MKKTGNGVNPVTEAAIKQLMTTEEQVEWDKAQHDKATCREPSVEELLWRLEQYVNNGDEVRAAGVRGRLHAAQRKERIAEAKRLEAETPGLQVTPFDEDGVTTKLASFVETDKYDQLVDSEHNTEVVSPCTFIVGVTQPDFRGIEDYLKETGQLEFLEEFKVAMNEHGSICLASMYAKMCYRSLVPGKNDNVRRTRSIGDNIVGTFNSGHGSVFEHVCINFQTANCSRVFTHQLVRHRVGTAYSQSSGHFCTVGDLNLVLPQDVPPHIANRFADHLQASKDLIDWAREEMNVDEMGMKDRKWWTSTFRRVLPEGASGEMGWSMNIRCLRNILQLRTHPSNSWEVRRVFTDVGRMILKRWPMMLAGGHRVGYNCKTCEQRPQVFQMVQDLPFFDHCPVCVSDSTVTMMSEPVQRSDRDEQLDLDYWECLSV